MRRVPEVIDVWWDSGCDAVRPVARAVRERGPVRASASRPTTSARRSTRRAAGSTRCSRCRRCCSAQPSYETCLCLGLILDPEGQKMSKSQGQRRRALGRARRATARTPSAGTTSPPSSPGTATASRSRRSASRVRQFLQARSGTPTRFYVLYANVNGVERDAERPSATDLDRWILSRLAATDERVIERMEDYDTTSAGRAIAEFVDDLSNWYVRRSRRRFWDGDPARASRRCTSACSTVAKLLAPLTPFVADEIYENLDGSEPSVHLCDFPEPARARRASSSRTCRSCATRSSSAAPPARRQDEGAPAAARGRGGGRRPRARGDRALRAAGAATS